MRAWRPEQWPLRTRVAVAFLVATGGSIVLLGVAVQVGVGDALDDRLREVVSIEAERLETMTPADRSSAVAALGGEVHAQVLSPQGRITASSTRLVGDPMIGTDGAAPALGAGWVEGTVAVLDDDRPDAGRAETERETLVMSVTAVEEGVLVVGTTREDADEALAAVRDQLVVAGPLALGLAGLLGYLVAAAGLRPVERMRVRAATISTRTAGERLPLPAADDELRRLAVTLNEMLGRLDLGIQRERRFAAEAGHDLRTPLALMLTEVELALAQPRGPDELRQALGSIHEEVRRLIVLAEDLLGRAGSGETGLPLASRPVDLADVAARVVERFKVAAEGRAIELTAPRPVEVRGDATRLDRAVSNLVDNALRHGAGDIGVTVCSAAGSALVSVVDHGDGPPSDAGAGSGGWGLAIVREIARAHGGSVTVQRCDDTTRASLEIPSSTTT